MRTLRNFPKRNQSLTNDPNLDQSQKLKQELFTEMMGIFDKYTSEQTKKKIILDYSSANSSHQTSNSKMRVPSG